jgi:hypothetical protein
VSERLHKIMNQKKSKLNPFLKEFMSGVVTPLCGQCFQTLESSLMSVFTCFTPSHLFQWPVCFWEEYNRVCSVNLGRSQWPSDLRHELFSPARTLGSWVRIPLDEWMFVGVYSVFVLFCVQVAALRRAYHPSKESCRLCMELRI